MATMEGRVGIKLNDRMSQIVSSVLSSHTTTNTTSLTEEDINILRADRDRGVLSPRSFKLISHWNQQHQGPPLFSAIKEVKAELPKLKRDPIEESEEKRKRREYLLMKQEEREYNKMIFGNETNPIVDSNLSMNNQFNSFKNQASMGFNMLFSVLATFGMAYYIAGQMGNNSSMSMIYGLIFAILVLVVEMVLFIMRAVQIENTLEKAPTQEKHSLAKMQSGAFITPCDDPSVIKASTLLKSEAAAVPSLIQDDSEKKVANGKQ